MLLKFAFKDILDDHRFKNTTRVNIRNYQTLRGEFINYCVNVLLKCTGGYDASI
ncbi:hypothetical protein GCM10010911_61960 [Paenibacillus nasutitermitis]|uniref:Uncharacterized protein n=1 Tax=Paenibacillus nasutitermitis TaxID=1652958 RepID=A0A916ZFU5_9BACL|nr:hypothetical protein GCM10010911_61960 [Paenibacillus nasutitermitis]